MKIIALLGKSRVGKDTAAAILSTTLGFPIVRLSAPIKDACHVLFYIPRDDLDSAQKEIVDPRYEKTPRDLLVWMTHAVQKEFPPSFFFQRMLSSCPHTCRGIVIPDLRYEHDLRMIQQHQGMVLKITRSDAPVLHSHEAHIDALPAGVVLRNDGDLEEFEKRVCRVATCIKLNWGRE